MKHANVQDEPHGLLASSGVRMVVCHWWDELSITIEDATRIVFSAKFAENFPTDCQVCSWREGFSFPIRILSGH